MLAERINTCVSLFNSCNNIDSFVLSTIDLVIRIDNLSEEDRKKIESYNSLNDYTEEDRQCEWYKIVEEITSMVRPPSDNFQKMLISMSALFISLYKERIIDKDNNKQLSLRVNQCDYNDVLNVITKKINDKYYIGDIEFDNPLQCMDFLRNKLLHGDYHIVDNNIILTKDNKTGSIPFMKLIDFCFILSNLCKCNGKTLEDSMVVLTHVKYSNSGSLKEFLRNNLFSVDFKFTIKGKRSLNMDVINLKNEIEDLVMHYNLNYPMFLADTIETVLKEKDAEISACKCRVEYEIKPYILKGNANRVINRFIQEYRKFRDKDCLTVTDLLNYVNSNSFVNNVDTLNNSYMSLANYLLKFMPSLSSGDVKSDLPDDGFDVTYGHNIPFNLLRFYCYFNYGLDSIFSGGITTNLRDIFEGRKFDYSQLDLSLFEDPNMTVEHTITSYQDQVNGINNEYNKTLAAYQKILNSYNGFKARFGTSKPDVEAILFQNCEKAKEQLQRITDLQNKSNNFDFNKYVRNLNIINHLRNSIAHGNYELDDADLNNIYYVFNDVYNGVTTYTLRIKVEDFKRIFDGKSLIHDYLDNLSNNYLGKSMEELRYEELLINCSYVKEDKREEWNNKVNDAINNKDTDELNKLYYSYVVMKELNEPSLYVKSFDKHISAVGWTIAHFFDRSLSPLSDSYLNIFDTYISVSDYFDIVKNVLEYLDEADRLEEFIKQHILPLCDEGAMLLEYYQEKGISL